MELSKEYLDSLKNVKNLDIDKLINCYDKPAFLGVRFNTQKIEINDVNTENLQKYLKKCNIMCNLEPISWCNTGFYYNNEAKLGKNILHEAGLYYLQEPSAMAPVQFLDVKPNDVVLDLCAAPGGKSTQIANKLIDGFLIANEIVPSRAKILCENVQRLGIKNAVVANHSPKELEKHFENFFDKILIDAPCSGEGMFRKNNEAINEWTPLSPLQCANRQKEIVTSAYRMLKPNGNMVYSTCTFSIEENEEIIKYLLDAFDDLELLDVNHEKYNFEHGIDLDGTSRLTKCARLYPYKVNGEGHFFAVLHKKASNATQKKNTNKQKQNKQHISIFEKFIGNYSNNKYTNYVSIGDYLYANCPIDIDKLKVLNAGIFLGEVRKNIFIPSLHFAHTFKPYEFNNVYDITEDEAKKYLQGFELDANLSDGWVLLTYNNLPLSFGKVVCGKIKNHYPKYLRKNI